MVDLCAQRKRNTYLFDSDMYVNFEWDELLDGVR